MKLANVMEFENFVTFVFDEGSRRVCAQYRTEQVWKDENDVWHVSKDRQPFHISTLPPEPKPKVAPELEEALNEIGYSP